MYRQMYMSYYPKGYRQVTCHPSNQKGYKFHKAISEPTKVINLMRLPNRKPTTISKKLNKLPNHPYWCTV